ncbi:YgiT-type zinc finger protein [Paenibacillus sp. H1-7]|uniref:YgiT-type zinc finger protein n=1 Tax=Paenibacillus sp. H1-7 TaxID=2282849 RepID=UPI001EF7993E|nr:YgiT-type zinc finger protein [Paenibacillus sp. H1-7]
MITNKELEELGVIKSAAGVFVPSDFCFVSLLNYYQNNHTLTDEQHSVISDFLLELEVDLGICDGSKEEIRKFKNNEGTYNDAICPACGKLGTEIVLENKMLSIDGIKLTIPAVPASRCLKCGEIYYEQEALDFIDKEVAAFHESRRDEE